MKRYSLCPICGEERLHEHKTTILRELDNFKMDVPFHTSVCDACGSETVTDKQATFNKRQMTDFYRAADGLLTGSQIKALRDDMSLTQSMASQIFGGGKNAFTKYENADVTQSVAMDKLIRTAYAVPAALEFLKNGCPRIVSISYQSIPTMLQQEGQNLSDFLMSVSVALSSLNVAKSGKVEVKRFHAEPETNKVEWELMSSL